ncbi:hypothetical protein AAC387_Pa01g3790 [Persea americana]
MRKDCGKIRSYPNRSTSGKGNREDAMPPEDQKIPVSRLSVRFADSPALSQSNVQGEEEIRVLALSDFWLSALASKEFPKIDSLTHPLYSNSIRFFAFKSLAFQFQRENR